MSSVTLPNSITSIGGNVFFNCTSLYSIEIPNSVTSIGNHAFAGCSRLYSITIPNSVTSIGGYAFSHCTSLTSATIPNSISSISSGLFYNCSRLSSISIPQTVTSIANGAFVYCGLKSINFSAVTPPELGSNVFYHVDKSIPLYVPEASFGLYQAAFQWKDFYNIQIGLDDINVANNINVLIYPNPAKDKAKISIDNLNSKADIIIHNIMGKEVKREVISKGIKELELNISNLNRGVYNVRICSKGIDLTKKLVVE